MKTLVFDIYGDLGHFKKYYTTSSPLTFSFPPPPTVRGMLGAIIGADKENYLQVFSHEKCKLAVRILSPISKIRMGLNHINTKGNYWVPIKKGSHEARTQIRTEFVKNPAYRIYVSHEDNKVFDKLVENIMAHKTVFTLSLGLSELLSDFRFVGVKDFVQGNKGYKEIVTVIPMNTIEDYGIDFEQGKKYFKEKIAIEMSPERVVERYEDVLFEVQGKPIRACTSCCWEDDSGEHIIFF
ncbi:MAG TPA: type I-B CRISPR-associated protein Cas5 [Thermoanaerobacterales bacterium]|nr:type I-B CRISPR-associated protein Cas5 [Thermoanaerobacterales bacterium]